MLAKIFYQILYILAIPVEGLSPLCTSIRKMDYMDANNHLRISHTLAQPPSLLTYCE
jgi:hypothetical protein